MSILASIGFLGLLAAPAAAFWRLPCAAPLVVERADPIISPGNVSGHVHQIMGGNGFDFEMDYADTQASTCTSCTVHGDFSNYWTPVLYYQHQDGTFEKVDQVGGGLVYYLQRTGPNNDKLQAFPEGFRMLAGNPFKRSGGSDFASQAVSYNCLDYNKQGGNPETGGFPNMNCPDGLRSQVFFPSCWDGKNLYLPDQSHMSYPIGAYNDGACPSTHPVHLISIFYEIIWNTNAFADKWYGNSQPFVWAMGDPTGYGFHGDFLMGWDRDLLQRAVDQCTNLSGQVEDCPVFNLYPTSTAQGCKLAPRINENVQGPFAQLPGCNPVRQGPGMVPPIATCAGNTQTIGQGQSFFTDLTSSGWGYQGCGADNYYNRAFTGASTSSSGMTNEQCVQFCGSKGFSVAGSEYSNQCYCANSIPASAQPVPGVVGNCNMPCAGNASEFCGGSALMSIYQKCTGSSCSNAAGVGGGSSVPSSSPQSSPKAYTTTSTQSSVVQRPQSSSTSSSIITTTTAATTTTPVTRKPSGWTSSSSTTSAVQSSVPNQPSTSGLPPNWTYLTCLTDTVNPRTLPKLAPYTINGTLMTTQGCTSWCYNNGYSFGGTEYAGECWCGNSIAGSTKLDASKCNMACKGNGSQMCGGPAALSLYGDASKVNMKRDIIELPDANIVRAHMRRT